MGAVTAITLNDASQTFDAVMQVNGFRIVFSADMFALANGASLYRLRNEWVREVIAAHGPLINARDLKATAKEATELMRPKIESFFCRSVAE